MSTTSSMTCGGHEDTIRVGTNHAIGAKVQIPYHQARQPCLPGDGNGSAWVADSGTRYQSKLFNPVFLREKGLPCPDWL